MRQLRLLAFLLTGLPAALSAQERFQTVRGTVQDTAGQPIRGADVLLGNRRTVTNYQGAFRLDSVRVGNYLLTIRLAGFTPLRSRIAITEMAPPPELEYELSPAPFILPQVISSGRRSGIYGAVGDTTYRSLPGARVQVAGLNGGEMLADSVGRFAFPQADRGPYLIRVTHPGYGERRFSVELKPGEGKDVVVLLNPARSVQSRADDKAMEDLHKRIALNLNRERMTPTDLARYGSVGLCDVPRLLTEIGRSTSTLVLLLNGIHVLREFPVSGLCAWRADEVDLVEFGKDYCADVTQTLAEVMAGWCSGRSRNVPRSIMGGGSRVRTQGSSTSYVVIWEKR